MKKEYDFSKGVRGKFYRPGVELNIPVFLEPDVAKVVREYKAGKVEFRNDAGGIVHAVVGKLSFDAQKLADNIQAFIHHIHTLKPNSVKGTYVNGSPASGAVGTTWPP